MNDVNIKLNDLNEYLSNKAKSTIQRYLDKLEDSGLICRRSNGQGNHEGCAYFVK